MNKQIAQLSIEWKSAILVMSIFMLVVLFLGACRNTSDVGELSSSQIIVTKVYVVTGEEIVITQVIELTHTPTPPPTSSAEEKVEPVTLDIAFVRNEAPSIDPQQNVTGDGIDLIENLFVGLTRLNYDTNQVEPALAEDWEVSNNGRTWTFRLRDDVYWVKPGKTQTDGLVDVIPVRPVTADDVVFAIWRACRHQPVTPDAFILFVIQGCQLVNTLPEPTAPDLELIGVRALNDSTLQFTLTKPAAHFLTLTTLWFTRPLPPELVETYGDEWQTKAKLDEELMTSGPFFPLDPELETLQINPLWPLPRKGNIDLVNIFYATNSASMVELWQNRQLDVISAASSAVDFTSDRIITRLQFAPQQTLYYLGFSMDSGVFREPTVRRAFAAAIDRERLASELYGIQAEEMRHLIPPGVVGALPVGEVGVGYSPDYARQQLAESGFRSCQLMPAITFLVSSSDLSLQQAELIRRMWIEELGCTEQQIRIDQAQFGTLLANTRPDAGAARPDVWELAWASYYPDGNNWMGDFLHCEESENRHNRPCSAEDDLVRQANSVLDIEERTTLYRQLENRFFGDAGIMPLVPLFIRREPLLVQTWLTTFTPAPFSGEQYDTYIIDVQTKALQRSR